MQFPAHFARAGAAPYPEHDRCGESLFRLEIISRCEWIHTAQGAYALTIVVKCALKAAGPGERPGQHTAGVLLKQAIEGKHEGRIAELVSAHADFGIQNFG